jgi:hypothetical protein
MEEGQMVRASLRRTASRTLPALTVLVGAITGTVLLSGSDQPVTAHTYPHWQQLAVPPLTARTEALGANVGPRVLVLGGVGGDWSRLRDGATYDLRTGRWHHLALPVPVTARDDAVAAAGTLVVRHLRPGRAACWWTFAPRTGTWERMRHLPRRLSAPSSFRSEVYAVSGRRVVVYSVQLGRWTPLPTDPHRLFPRHPRVTAGPRGTVVAGRVGAAVVVDRWDGLRWHRSWAGPAVLPSAPRPALPTGVRRTGATLVPVGGRLVVVGGGRAWIHTP